MTSQQAVVRQVQESDQKHHYFEAVSEYIQTFAVKTSISLQLTFLLHRFLVLHIDYCYLCCNFLLSSNISNNVFVCQ